MPLDHTAARKLALLLYEEPLVKVTELKRIADGAYRIRFVDRRDGRTHTILEPGQIAEWLDSIVQGRVLHSAEKRLRHTPFPGYGTSPSRSTTCVASSTASERPAGKRSGTVVVRSMTVKNGDPDEPDLLGRVWAAPDPSHVK